MNFEIVDSSPEAMQCKPKEAVKIKYPFDDLLTVGRSFRANADEVNFKSIRSSVYQQNRKGDKEFVCINHESINVIEVARIK